MGEGGLPSTSFPINLLPYFLPTYSPTQGFNWHGFPVFPLPRSLPPYLCYFYCLPASYLLTNLGSSLPPPAGS